MLFAKFLSRVQESEWYSDFLNFIVKEIPNNSLVLDIGTGTGKLLELLFIQKNTSAIGIDTNQEMLHEAKKKLKYFQPELHFIEEGKTYPFEGGSYECITICNVLFNLNDKASMQILNEASRLLKKDGKIIILTPTGRSGIYKQFRKYNPRKNFSLLIWHLSTKKRAIDWNKKFLINSYAKEEGMKYELKTVFNGFSQIEILRK